MIFDRDDITFLVVVNHEEQYSIWPEFKETPAGGRAVGRSGFEKECLACIDEVWTDMRPLSLRRYMDAQASELRAAGSRVGAPADGADAA